MSKLIFGKIRKKGRSFGKISVRHKGGGAKKLYRLIDFGQDKLGVPGKVVEISYDPFRTAKIAQVNFVDGDKRYILAPNQVEVGWDIIYGKKAPNSPGNRKRLADIPVGTVVYNIELTPGMGAQIVRSAGTGAKILGREGKYVIVQLPSKEVRKVNKECYATIGSASNWEHENIRLKKAGDKRHRGIRPQVRGKAMSPRAHPHGGGEGVNPIGLPGPKTPWGKPALGYKTRRPKKYSDQFIIKKRK